MTEKAQQKASLIGRIFCMEALLIVTGLFLFVSGIYREEYMQLFWGAMIITGAIVLNLVRKKDWPKHWEEQEKRKKVYDEIDRIRREEKNAQK